MTGCFLLPQTFDTIADDNDSNKAILIGISTMKIRKNNFFLKRHFGCIPGSIIIEFAEQTAALLVSARFDIAAEPIICRLEDPGPRFGKIRTVAGDTLTATIKLSKYRRAMYYFNAVITNQKQEMVLETGIVGANSAYWKERMAA